MSGIPAGAGSLLGKRLGKYEILALLALGGTAEIYLARIGGAAGFEKYVVVKCLHDHLADDQVFVKMFLDEARLAAHLDHSNVVQTMELGEHEDRYYMVMEFLAGLSLAMMVRRAAERLPGGRIPVPFAINMIAQACAGLHYAHERAVNGKALGIVHRDISPQNLVVSFEGVVKVVDFGIAKAEVRETRTQSGTIKGKFAYMSPEQCVAHHVDRRTDVFALGVIAHELLTGRRLFKRNSPYDTYQAVLACDVPAPSRVAGAADVDAQLDEIILRACAKEKEGRYPTAEAFGDALLGYLHHRGKGSGPGEIARFFDAHFAQEIAEHGARMNELMAGRDGVPESSVSWGDDELEAKRRNETVDLTRGQDEEPSIALEAADLLTEDRSGTSGLSDVIAGLGRRDSTTGAYDRGGAAANDFGGEDELPEATRIESNPLERVKELDKVAKTPPPQLHEALRKPAGAEPRRPPPIMAPTIVPAGPIRPLTPPPVAPAPPRVAPPGPPSGALPLPAPPTGPVMTSPDPGPASSGKFVHAANLPTMIAQPEPAPRPPNDQASTEVDGQAYVDAPAPAHAAPHLHAAPAADPLARTAMDMRAPAAPPQRPSQASIPMSYPVMNKELSAQMMAGATVFPSPPARASAAHEAQRAAELASPVGPSYPEQNWEAAAAMRARALPPWKLAALFFGVVVGALLLTVIVAKIFS